MNDIRVTYSGLISLLMSFLRIFTGFGFTLIITRLLLPDDLGTWRLILGLTSSVVFMNITVTFWSTRDVARGIDSAKTAMSLSGIFSMVGVLIFFIAVLFTNNETDASEELLYGIIIIPCLFFHGILYAIVYGYKPHLINVGQFVYGIVIVIASIILTYFLEFGLLGIIISSAIAYLSVTCLFLYSTKKVIKNKFNFKIVKKWFKNSWIAIYYNLSGFIFSFDVLIFSLITTSVSGLAYLTAASGIGALVGIAGSITIATYPKLLSSDKFGFLQDNITRVFYFALPLLTIIVLFAKEGLFIFNPIYVDVYPAVSIFAFRMLLYMFSSTFSNFLTGSEKVDIYDKSTMKDFLKSKLFHIPTVKMIRNISYIGSLVIMLLVLSVDYSDIELVIFWSILMLAVELPFTIYFYIKVKRVHGVKIEWVRIIKYALSSIVSIGFAFYLAKTYLVYDSIFVFVPNLLAYVIFGVIIYFGITYTIDKKTRDLTKAIINELQKKIS